MLRQVNPHYTKNPDQNSKKYTTKLKNYHSNPPYNCVLSLLYKHVYDNQPGKIHSTFYMNKVTFPKKFEYYLNKTAAVEIPKKTSIAKS